MEESTNMHTWVEGREKSAFRLEKQNLLKEVQLLTVPIKTETGLMFVQNCVHRFCLSLQGIFFCGTVGVVEDSG